MKLIIAHLPDDALDSVRTELLDIGVPSITTAQVHSSATESLTALRYRGVALERHMRSELRIECVVTPGQSPAVVSLLRARSSMRGGSGGRVIVLDVEELHEDFAPEEAYADDPRRDVAV